MWRFIKRLFVLGKLVVETIEFIRDAIDTAQSSTITDTGRELIDKWRDVFPNQVLIAESLKETKG